MINTFDTDKNFWIEHPDMKVISPFKQIFEDDKSKKKEDSSKMMWFIVLCYDRDSKLFKQSISEKHRIIGEDFMGDAKYYQKWKIVLDAAIQVYTDLQYTPMQKLMASWDKKLHERAKWLDGLSFEDDDERVDKAMERTKKVYDGYKQIMDDMHKEDNSGMAKGGATPSLLD
jgi:tRNA splicing endonuclease